MPLRPMQAKQFSVATTKIRIGRRPRCRYDRCRRAIPHCSSDDAASIPKSGLEIKNHCSPGVKSRENRALILKFGPEIKNRCTQEGLNREILHRFPSLGLKSRIDAAPGSNRGKIVYRFSSLSLKSRIDACSRPSSARVH